MSTGQPGSQDHSVMAYLQMLLEQLEGAQGGPDPEARQKLEVLKVQLRLMESAQQGQCEVAVQTEVAVARELDSLDIRLTSLEERLEGLDGDARLVVQQSVVGWVGATVGEAAEGSAGAQQGGGSPPPGAS